MSFAKMFVMAWMAAYCADSGPVCHQNISTLKRPPVQESGKASWYGTFENKMHGDRTATGEKFDPQKKTAATRNVPLGTWIMVENKTSGTSAWCRVNDRGPYAADYYHVKEGEPDWGIKIKVSGGYMKQPWVNGDWGEKTIVEEDPGEWRAVIDLSIGCARAAGFDHNAGFNHVNIRYYKRRHDRTRYSLMNDL